MGKYLNMFLEQYMSSQEGSELCTALETIIEEEKQCINLFQVQINHCIAQIDVVNKAITASNPTHELMLKKRAFEEHRFILNVAAQFQQCSYETKGIQKVLYFEKNKSTRERSAVAASVVMYEWCDDLNALTGKQFQDIAKRLLSPSDLAKTRIARKQLSDFYEQEKSSLSTVRHNAGAHRDHDFMKEREILDNVDWSETIERLHEFEVRTLELGKSIKPLIEAGLKQIGEAFDGKKN